MLFCVPIQVFPGIGKKKRIARFMSMCILFSMKTAKYALKSPLPLGSLSVGNFLYLY